MPSWEIRQGDVRDRLAEMEPGKRPLRRHLYCFLMAGWSRAGWSKSGKMLLEIERRAGL